MNELIDLQRRLDDLALRLDGDDRQLVFEARSELYRREVVIARIRQAASE